MTRLMPGGAGLLFALSADFALTVPSFSIDGVIVDDWAFVSSEERTSLHFLSATRPDAQLRVELWTAEDQQVYRFRLHLTCPGQFTKPDGKDSLRYFSIRGFDFDLTEWQMAHFDANTNIYKPAFRSYDIESRYEGQSHCGPIVISEGNLVAYEHGGDVPSSFVQFRREGDLLHCEAVKGNYYHGQTANYESIWFQVARTTEAEDLLPRYRQFMLNEVCAVKESREPYIFYNTWNHQERQKYLKGEPYLSDMNLERMLAEIEVAHEIGIEVFVIDTGWYAKTGDWEVDLDRFPDGLQSIRKKLDEYGMKLGLWFNPIVAARTSRGYAEHPEWVRINDKGEPDFWGQIWETEESYAMCLCTGWADVFAETLIRLNRELGVSYFKWDAVGLYGCQSDAHNHGTAENSIEERRENFAFESSRQLVRIVEKVTQACPGSIVDFDVTESGRYFGLSFLSAGKLFLVNNGPYYHNFDTPNSFKRDPETINAFFFPGAARPRMVRGGFRFDPVVPSILFLTHYLPDGPELSQINSLASLMLGGNGIWGSLPDLSVEERTRLRTHLDLYKQVRHAVTRSNPIVVGEQGTSPEIHEKIDPKTGQGVIAFFTVAPGTLSHVTQPLDVLPGRIEGASDWSILPGNRVRLSVKLGSKMAVPVYFLP